MSFFTEHSMNEPQPELLDVTGGPRCVAGLYIEIGRQKWLIALAKPAVTPGMITVSEVGQDYENRPELRQQNWPDRLMPVAD
jgi:hypothetical protein